MLWLCCGCMGERGHLLRYATSGYASDWLLEIIVRRSGCSRIMHVVAYVLPQLVFRGSRFLAAPRAAA